MILMGVARKEQTASALQDVELRKRYAIGINDRLFDVPKEVYDEINRLREEALKNV